MMRDMLEQLVIIGVFVAFAMLILVVGNIIEAIKQDRKEDFEEDILDVAPKPLFIAEGRMTNGSKFECSTTDFDELLDIVSNEYSDDELDKDSVYYFEEIDGIKTKLAFP